MYLLSLEPGSPPPSSVREKKKEGESLEDLDHVLDIDDVYGHGFQLAVRFAHATERTIVPRVYAYLYSKFSVKESTGETVESP